MVQAAVAPSDEGSSGNCKEVPVKSSELRVS